MLITVKKNLLLFFGWYSINFSLLVYTKIKSTKTINVFIKSSALKKFLSRNSLLKLIKIFKVKNTNTAMNASGGDYLYMAFAESPFKTATAR